MKIFSIFFFLFVSFVFTEKTFRAASMALFEKSTPESYAKYVESAEKKGSEIIVFPELSLGLSKEDGEIVTLNSNPCLQFSKKSRPRQYTVSCAARKNEIYVVLTLLEYDGDKIYNTAVVFDRSGEIFVKYRKIHVLFPFLTKGDTGPQHFTTDFGQTFGLFICFDILFNEPAEILVKKYGITNFLYPQHWVTEPMLNALQCQQSFSEFFSVNLIASNDLSLSRGCGHFSKGVPLAISMNKTSDVMLVTDFPVLEYTPPPKLPSISTKSVPFIIQQWFPANYSGGETKKMNIDTPFFSCNLTYEVMRRNKKKEHSPQWFTFFAYRVIFEEMGLFEDICGILICDDGDKTELMKCFNESKDVSYSYFNHLELTQQVRDNVRSVRTLLGSDGMKLFENQKKKQYEIIHSYDVHSVKMKNMYQPVLSVDICSMLEKPSE